MSLLCLCLGPWLLAQDIGTEATEYEIAGVRVEGAEYSDDGAIIALTGLKVGKKLLIPGPKIAKAITNLYQRRLFTNVTILQEKQLDDYVWLIIRVEERPRYSRHTFRGEKKNKHDDLNEIVDKYLVKGGIITEDLKENTLQEMEEYYREKGYLDAEVTVVEELDEKLRNSVKLIFSINKGDKVKIQDITFSGNDQVSDRKLRKVMGNTKRKKVIFRGSKLIAEDYEEDKKSIIDYYNENGYRDARILGDSIYRASDGDLVIQINIDEGQKYHIRNISWKGNSLFSEQRLNQVLGIAKGDIYNDKLLDERLRFSLDGRDVSSLYLDDGYLFFRVDPVEVAIVEDSIDIEMRIFEGPQATIDKVEVVGNDRTHDHVILRELRTRPGEKFSRSDIIRSQRELLNLGYFDPATLDVQTPVNPQKGTVDIIYNVTERPSDQLELSAGWGGTGAGVFGTLGVVFNNFSIRNLFNGKAWRPLPQGDGQKLSLRFQSNGRFWRSFNFSFTEPWLGGKKPNSFSLGGSDLVSNFNGGRLQISRIFSGIGTRLRWPDDNFIFNGTVNLERIGLRDRVGFSTDDGDQLRNGGFYNLSTNFTIARSTINEPIFPKTGSRVSLSLQLTPPYSLFKGDDFYIVDDQERGDLIASENADRAMSGLDPLSSSQEGSFINDIQNTRKFRLLEYHKWRVDAEWYTPLVGNLVLKTKAQLGFLGSYSDAIGISPFERFELGGDGISNAQRGIEGKDVISLRGYDPGDLLDNGVFADTEFGRRYLNNGAPIFNKYTVELRYPLSTNPNSTIYFHTFVQGGNVFKRFRDYSPFNLRKSAGFGMRVFLPMFGILGFDYGIGFDKPDLVRQNAGLGSFAQFNIILGFEPD